MIEKIIRFLGATNLTANNNRRGWGSGADRVALADESQIADALQRLAFALRFDVSDFSQQFSAVSAGMGVFQTDRDFFAKLRDKGCRQVPIPLDIGFSLSSSFAEFSSHKPIDGRPSIPGVSGGKSGNWYIKEKVSIDEILQAYDHVMACMEEAARRTAGGNIISLATFQGNTGPSYN